MRPSGDLQGLFEADWEIQEVVTMDREARVISRK